MIRMSTASCVCQLCTSIALSSEHTTTNNAWENSNHVAKQAWSFNSILRSWQQEWSWTSYLKWGWGLFCLPEKFVMAGWQRWPTTAVSATGRFQVIRVHKDVVSCHVQLKGALTLVIRLAAVTEKEPNQNSLLTWKSGNSNIWEQHWYCTSMTIEHFSFDLTHQTFRPYE
jgi:hypothetical protein